MLKDLEKNPPAGVLSLYLNLEKLDSVPAWLQGMLKATRATLESQPDRLTGLKTSAKQVGGWLKRIEEIQILGNGIKLTAGQPAIESWRPMAEQFLTLLREAKLPIYFLLDEFPWFLGHVAKKHTVAEVESVLNWFRDVRHELSDLQARFLVTGSIGLDGLLRRLGLTPTGNDFDSVDIPPLEDKEALQFLADLAEGEGLTLPDAVRRQILKLLGANWPLLLALFVSEIQESGASSAPTTATLKRLYEEQMVRGNRNKYCQEMFSRLSKPELFSPGERRLAQEILRELAARAQPFGRQDFEAIHARLVPDAAHRALVEDELAFVLDTLRHDGYLHRDPGGLTHFSSNILRDYWQHRTA